MMVPCMNSLMLVFVLLPLLAFAPTTASNVVQGRLYPQFYHLSCPNLNEIVQSVVSEAVAREPRMAASLLRLHFHDCFVQGCDASVLLDSSGSIISEKRSNPNRDSIRGFEVIDQIKAAVEKSCPETVSCADIVALAARTSTVLRGGPYWDVPLGRRDSRSASLSGSNTQIPAPNSTLPTLISSFSQQGLTITDLVALSGSHTIGNSRCASFKARLFYNQNQMGNGDPNAMLDQLYAAKLRTTCPPSGGDQNLFFLDPPSPLKFDNSYFNNLLHCKGLLQSDQVLFTKGTEAEELVKQYAENEKLFFEQFAESMIKMGNISPLLGSQGEIRKICRRVNRYT